jgi:F-type H+-transporting ATPase subunit delta
MATLNERMLTVADVYAEGLLEVASGRGQEHDVAAEYADLVVFLGDHPDVEEWLVSEAIDVQQRRDSLEKLFRGRMHDLLLNLLQVLNQRRRQRLVRAVQRRLELRMQSRRGAKEITVYTAMPLWHEMRTAIRAVVTGWLGRTPILVEEIRPEIIGGIVIRIDDLWIDGSVQGRLERMRRRVSARGRLESIHSERYLDAPTST